MKKVLTFALVLAVCFSTFATINLTKDGSLTLDIYNATPLYEESASDPYAFATRLGYDICLDPACRPTSILCNVKDKAGESSYEYLPIAIEGDYVNAENKTYVSMKPAMTLSLLRFEYETDKCPKLQFEINLDGYINTVFNAWGRNHTLDFDGSYFIGGTFKALDKYALRVGIHHFSGHYGDEVLELLYSTNGIRFEDEGDPKIGKGDFEGYTFVCPVEYVRDNSWFVSASADLPFGFRVYTGLEAPKKDTCLRPLAHCPAGYTVWDSYDLIERIGSDADDGEHVSKDQIKNEQTIKDSSYKALRAELGFEWEYSFKEFGVFASADLQLHQDGKTMHQLDGYKKDNKWDKEISLAAGVELYSVLPEKSLQIEVLYHQGRLSATQWFYQPSKTVSAFVVIK